MVGCQCDHQLWGSGRGSMHRVPMVPCTSMASRKNIQKKLPWASCRRYTVLYIDNTKIGFAIWGLCWYNYSIARKPFLKIFVIKNPRFESATSNLFAQVKKQFRVQELSTGDTTWRMLFLRCPLRKEQHPSYFSSHVSNKLNQTVLYMCRMASLLLFYTSFKLCHGKIWNQNLRIWLYFWSLQVYISG